MVITKRWRGVLYRVLRNPGGAIGCGVLLIEMAAIIAGPRLYGVDPFDLVAAPFDPPSFDLPLGADYLGRDILAGLLVGGRASMAVGVAATLLSLGIGVTIGAVAGWFGRWADTVLMKVTEFFQVLPGLLLAVVLVSLFHASIGLVIFAIGIVSWPSVARLTRAEYMRVKAQDFVWASIAAGATARHLVLRVVLPNALPPIVVATALNVGNAILFEGGLSFLGLGDPNVMTWGLMLGQNRAYLLDAWWAVTFPGLAIFVTVMAVTLLGEAINPATNPRLQVRR